MIVAIILIVIAIVIAIKIYRSNYKLRYDSITFFEGCLGSGKTTLITRLAINERRKRVILNHFVKPLNIIMNIILFSVPVINLIYGFLCLKNKKLLFKMKKRGTQIYSNYPIWINKKQGFSIAVNKDLLNWLYRVNEDCIIVLDEVGYLFPNEMKKTDPLYQFCLTWMRHGTNALMFCASQSLDECNIVFRRKVNRCYHLTNLSRSLIPFFSKVQITMAIVSEDINSVMTDRIEDREENWYRFKYPKSHFASRYAKKYYNLKHSEIIPLSISYEKTFEKMNLKNGDKWKSFYYEFDN